MRIDSPATRGWRLNTIIVIFWERNNHIATEDDQRKREKTLSVSVNFYTEQCQPLRSISGSPRIEQEIETSSVSFQQYEPFQFYSGESMVPFQSVSLHRCNKTFSIIPNNHGKLQQHSELGIAIEQTSSSSHLAQSTDAIGIIKLKKPHPDVCAASSS